jgi:hypothetical protein
MKQCLISYIKKISLTKKNVSASFFPQAGSKERHEIKFTMKQAVDKFQVKT